MENKKENKEKDIDLLLKKYILSDKEDSINEELAHSVFNTKYGVEMDKAKEDKILGKRKGGGNVKWYFISFGLLILSLMLVIYYFKNESKPEQAAIVKEKIIEKDTDTSISSVDTLRLMERNKIFYYRAEALNIPKVLSKNDSLMIFTEPVIPKENEKASLIPILSEAERARFLHLKEIYLKAFVELNKTLYSRIDAGVVEYKARQTEVNTIYFRNFQVTNLEYKTFLIDLIIQGRREDYLTACVRSSGWKTYQLNDLADIYFQKEEYNDFPVVNVTMDGIKLYCKWLQEEGDKYCSINNIKSRKISVRLPSDLDWIYASYMGYARVPDCNNYNTIFSQEDKLVQKDFRRRIALINNKRERKFKDSLDVWYETNHFGMSQIQLNNVFREAFRRYNTFPSDTLFADRMRAYCIIGHTSELILDNVTNKIRLMGNCWTTKEEFNQLNEQFMKDGFSPYVGFRPLIIDENSPVYKNPFW